MSNLKKQVRTIYDERETLLKELLENADVKTNRALMEKEIDKIVEMDFATNQFQLNPKTIEVQKASYRRALLIKLNQSEQAGKRVFFIQRVLNYVSIMLFGELVPNEEDYYIKVGENKHGFPYVRNTRTGLLLLCDGTAWRFRNGRIFDTEF